MSCDHGAFCARCDTRLFRHRDSRTSSRSAAFAVAALALYPLAMTLPVLRIEQFGRLQETSILEGTATLLGSGQWLIGLVVLVCSVVIPLMKLVALVVLSTMGASLDHRRRAVTYHLVEWTGRWGMLDVLLVALLVAMLKLGDIVSVSPGPGAIAFCGCVLLSLIASACFDPHRLWQEQS